MGYSFRGKELVAVLHDLRWSDELPPEINGLTTNWVIECAVDEIVDLQDEIARLKEIQRTATGVVGTAHPNIRQDMVVAGWWDAMVIALAKAGP